ncbi:MAG: TrkH family potassium uptake protein [Akkermansiaceae bacterium]
MNFRILAKFLGALLLLVSIAMAACGLFAKLDVTDGNEAAAKSLFLSAFIVAVLGGVMMLLGIGKIERVPRREGIVVVGLGWLLCGVFGSLPYLLGEPKLTLSDAFFESVSGFTTTGSTVMASDPKAGGDIESWPRGILMWRAATQWLGGMGILVLFVALLSYLGLGSKSLFRNESSFQTGEASTARIRDTAMLLWKIYICITIVCAIGLKMMGLSTYNAIAHTFTVVSTAGFSPHNASIGHYADWGNSWLIELWLCLFMILCSISFVLWAVILRKRWKRLRNEEEGRLFVLISLVAVAVLVIGMVSSGDEDFLSTLRHCFFTLISLGSTTGYATVDYAQWPVFALVLISVLMIIGGCSGSTAGGMKVSRLIVFLKTARLEIVKAFRPNQMFRMHVNGNAMSDAERAQTVGFVALYAFIIIISCFVVAMLESGNGIDITTVFACVLATFTNTGPGFGEVGPAGNYSHLLPVTKVFLSLLMILGRLELYAVLVLFMPSLWRKY